MTHKKSAHGLAWPTEDLVVNSVRQPTVNWTKEIL